MPVKKTNKTTSKKKAIKKTTGAKTKTPVKKEKPKNRETEENAVCSFCSRPSDQVGSIIAGPNDIFICDECVAVSQKILGEHTGLSSCPLVRPSVSQALEIVGSEMQEPPALRTRIKYDILYLAPKNQLSEKIYNKILPIAGKHKLKIKHFKEIVESNVSFDKEIIDIYNAFFVIADINEKDHDVMYFLGMLHLMGKPMVILAQKPEDMPKSLLKNFFIPCKNDAITLDIVSQHFNSVFLSIKKFKKLTKGTLRRKE